MRIVGLMVTRNEADRYIGAVARWTSRIVDELAVYDDQSDDGTLRIAYNAGAVVRTRPDDEPSFMENESVFRWNAWKWMESYLELEEGDWVIVVDADEFLLGMDDSPRLALERAIAQAESESCDSLEMSRPETFGMRDDLPLIRMDGAWSNIRDKVAARWRPGLIFRNVTLAGGRVPTMPGPMLRAGDPYLLHVGYLRAEDRIAKQVRYTDHKGHSGTHVRSITAPGTLAPWTKAALPPEIVTALKESA